MIFTGDIALPSSSIVLPDTLPKGVWVGNLEGSLVDVDEKEYFEYGVYNNMSAIQKLCAHIPFRVFSVANNHFLDISTAQTTINNARRIGIPTIGGGENIIEAQKSIVVKDTDNVSYRLLAFGWETIQCIKAGKNSQGVNPYTYDNVISCVESALENQEPVICLMHWNYELELYPQPFDRDLAHFLIDMGVYAVIGCHAHRVQPIELYKGRPIVYGLGNFAFMQNAFMNKKLKFPEFTYKEIAFEVTKDGGFRVHHLYYNPEKQSISYLGASEVEDAPFSGMTSEEYKHFFKTNRFQKKLLPIFYLDDNWLSYKLKCKFVQYRHRTIKLLVSNKPVFNAIKNVFSKFSS